MRAAHSVIIPLALIIAGVAVRSVDPQPLQNLRGSTFDIYQNIAPRPYQRGTVRVIDIDDQSLERVGQWPWPRYRIAESGILWWDLG